MLTDTIKWIEINWKVLNTINDNRSIIGSTEVLLGGFEEQIEEWSMSISVSLGT